MPNIKSAKKRVKTGYKRNLRNKIFKSKLKTIIKKAKIAIENSTEDEAASVKLAIKKIDQAAVKGIIHRNCAARKKSNLVKKCH